VSGVDAFAEQQCCTRVSEMVKTDGVGKTGLGGERVLVAGGVLAENVRALDFWVRIAVSNYQWLQRPMVLLGEDAQLRDRPL
jgi:hypothetical protein